MSNLFEGICGRIAPGLCRLSMSGGIAVRTRAGYRTYDVDTGRLDNCDRFVLDIGEDFFFVVPTNRVRRGDIILAGGRPKCVIDSDDTTITAINFEDATVEKLLPEHHVFMGSTYIYGKIVSVFGRNGVKGGKGLKKMMKYMLFSGMLKGDGDGAKGMGGLLPMLLLGDKVEFMDGLFDDDADDDDARKGA